MPTFPAPSLGTSLLVEPTGWLSLGMGIYDGAPKIESSGSSIFERSKSDAASRIS
jgi:hypothetical protein